MRFDTVIRNGTVVTATDTYASDIGISGGRITAVAVVESNPALMYVAAASGGVWKTTDGGTHWTALFEHQGKALVNLPQAKAEKPPDGRGAEHHAEIAEPRGLVKVRLQNKGERSLAGRPAWDRGPDHETIATLRQAVVVGDAAGYGGHPVAVESL